METKTVSVESPEVEAVLKISGSEVKLRFKHLKSKELKMLQADLDRSRKLTKKEEPSEADLEFVKELGQTLENIAIDKLEKIEGNLIDVDGSPVTLDDVKSGNITIFLEKRIKELYKKQNDFLSTLKAEAEEKNVGQPQGSQQDSISSSSKSPDSLAIVA